MHLDTYAKICNIKTEPSKKELWNLPRYSKLFLYKKERVFQLIAIIGWLCNLYYNPLFNDFLYCFYCCKVLTCLKPLTHCKSICEGQFQ